jgi:hypothetical protein
MTPSPSLIDEIETRLPPRPRRSATAALWHITDLFIAGSDSYTEDHVTLFDDVIGKACSDDRDERAREAFQPDLRGCRTRRLA